MMPVCTRHHQEEGKSKQAVKLFFSNKNFGQGNLLCSAIAYPKYHSNLPLTVCAVIEVNELARKAQWDNRQNKTERTFSPKPPDKTF